MTEVSTAIRIAQIKMRGGDTFTLPITQAAEFSLAQFMSFWKTTGFLVDENSGVALQYQYFESVCLRWGAVQEPQAKPTVQ